MKKIILFFIGSLFGLSNAVAESNRGFFEWATTRNPAIDLNQDGTPDLFRNYEKNKLVKLIYRNSKQPDKWQKTLYVDDKISKFFFTNDDLNKRIRLIKKKNGILKEIVHFAKGKEIKRVVKNVTVNRFPRTELRNSKLSNTQHMVTKEYSRHGDGWKIRQVASVPVKMVNQDSTAPGTLNQRGLSIDAVNTSIEQLTMDQVDQYINDSDYGEAIGFTVGGSCSGKDKDLMVHASHVMFRNMLPCLHKVNPALAIAVASHVIEFGNEINCGAIQNSTDSAFARAMLDVEDASIDLNDEQATVEHLLSDSKYSGNYELAVWEMSNTFLHEMLHVLGIDHAHDSGENMDKDAVYGCAGACSPPQVMGVRPEEGCQFCVDVKVDGQSSDFAKNKCDKQDNYLDQQLQQADYGGGN